MTTKTFITADQMVWLIQHLNPTIPPHGPSWMVGMWMGQDGSAQSSDAEIIKWNVENIAKPEQATLLSQWASPAIQTSYQQYLTKSQVPTYIMREQGMIYLMQAGKWQGVLDYVASITDANAKIVANVAINSTSKWNRTSPFLNAAATAIGLTSDQVDQMFIDASKIEV